MAIKLNSVDQQIFNAHSAEFNAESQERAHLVTCGRLLMSEYSGKSYDALRTLSQQPKEFESRLPVAGENSYEQTNKNLREKLMLFCAKCACEQSHEVPPADYNDFLRNSRKFLKNEVFLRVLAGIVTDIVTPLLPITMSNALDWIADTYNVPMGKTYELDVFSNDIFLFEDDSWGASRSKPSNYLYSYPVTLNPQLKTAKATVKWYQMVGNDVDLGKFFNSISAGLYSKIMAMSVSAFTTAVSGDVFVPTALQFTNTSENWATAAARLAMVNGMRYRDIVAVGHPVALSQVLPSGNANASSVNLDSALTTMLGFEWAKYGYIGEYMGVRLMPLNDALVPGTQNTTITGVLPTDEVWLIPSNTRRPIAVGMESGTPITVELSPTQTADMTIDILVSAAIDAQPVFSSKAAVITV